MITPTFTKIEDIINFQNLKLKDALNYLNLNSPYYKSLFNLHGIHVSSVQSTEDLKYLPVTTKDDLFNNNMEFLCVARDKVVEYCSTSGTLGDPVIIAQTESDLQRLALNEYFSFELANISSKDTLHLMLSLDRQFMAGMAYYSGARKMGAGIIRVGPGNFGMHLQIIKRLQPTVLVAVPSFIVSLIGYSFEQNVQLQNTSVQKIICVGENLRNEDLSLNALGERIHQNWNVELYSTYASTEMQTAFTECSHGNGGHHQPNLVIFEILDENNNSLPPEHYGELTITTLGIEGMPLLRYKTGDICCYYSDPCPCGRITYRLSPIKGRKNQMIKYKGTTMYPPSLFNALNSIELISDYVIKLYKNDMGLDDLTLYLAVAGDPIACDADIRHGIQSRLKIIPSITYTSLESIHSMQQSEGKRKLSRLLDERSQLF